MAGPEAWLADPEVCLASQEDCQASPKTYLASPKVCLASPVACLVSLAGHEALHGLRGRGVYAGTFSLLYWIFSPIVGCYPKTTHLITCCPKASNGQQFSCHASLYWPRSSFGNQGGGPNRGQSPVDWGEISPSVHLFVHPSI